MRCPFCKEIDNDKVIDSRLSEAGEVIRRRRLCMGCGKRFTTKERVENEVRLMVVKRDGTRQPYDRSKVLHGIEGACYKRPLSEGAINQLVDEVEDRLFREFEREVPSLAIGQIVCEKLRQMDQIAYVRFASVYRQFKDLGELIAEARNELDRRKAETPGQGRLFE
ncbi:MAG TPA: transcriptional regulator NrdR [Phycisphaerae bacterium]|jgi:transcriptional repressor NrdR|nr:transcriptional repressor NrdR [Phycisphaerae bacterium]HOB76223.1 transcriptional regulator NrdR [Phycisphaerae bacterium]HOJ56197.1 transcriptional regulator NrdR [Phycisphaerae bacterium]HOL28077.1 transcriptional regulator NrdR [Phycisphaerae bacterium]HPP22435.1 transcriptional regulator NrdR [Phycisphaerae bacterium]